MKKIYVTTMYRYGSPESHSYITYVGFNKKKAIKQGQDVKEYRGNKYEPEVLSFIPDDISSIEVVLELLSYP